MTYSTGQDPDAEHGPELDATEARQGRWGRHMLWVLLAGLLLVAIALFGAWAWRAGDLRAVDDKARAVAEEDPPSPSRLEPVKQRPQAADPAPAQ